MQSINLEAKLAEQGYKLTNQRKLILRIFQETNKHVLTAQEVYDKVIQDASLRMNFSTVYRNLELLTKAGILNKILLAQGLNGFELKHNNNHHHHLICKSCGKTERINFCPLKEVDSKIFKDFFPTEHRFEVYGYCDKCK